MPMNNILKIKNTKFRDALMNHTEGETVYCEEEEKCFTWHDGAWIEVPGRMDVDNSFIVNYRELMVNSIKDFEPLNETQLNYVGTTIHQFVEKDELNKHYYALVSFVQPNQPYFTLFVPKQSDTSEDIAQAVIECLMSRGQFIYMEDWETFDTMITFWVRTEQGELQEYYLSYYDGGVIEYA